MADEGCGNDYHVTLVYLLYLQYVVATLLRVVAHRVQVSHLFSHLVRHLLLHVYVGRGRLAAERLHHQRQAALLATPGRAALRVYVLFDAMPVRLGDTKPMDHVT